MSATEFTPEDLGELHDRTLAEIGRRLGDPAEMRKMTPPQLMALSKTLMQMRQVPQDTGPVEFTRGEELDIVALISKLPLEDQRRHVLEERAFLYGRLEKIEKAVGADDRWRIRLKEARRGQHHTKTYAKNSDPTGDDPDDRSKAEALTEREVHRTLRLRPEPRDRAPEASGEGREPDDGDDPVSERGEE